MKERKKGMARLIEIAFIKKGFVIASIILSILASIASFIPYISIYLIIIEIFNMYPNIVLNSDILTYGWYALFGVIANIVLYMLALSCSHIAAFDTLYKLKVDLASYVAKLPLGFHFMIGSGKIRKIMDENIEKIEGFIAHQIPDIVAAIVAPIVMLVIVFAVDWRFGIAVFIGIALSLAIQMSLYGKEGSKKMMDNYQNSLNEMNNASVEYVRGISVVKAFNQTIYSFRKLYETIEKYISFVIPYTLSWQNGFSGFSTLINNIYLFLIPTGIIIGINAVDYAQFASNFIFYLIFVPSIATILMKLMYVSSDAMRIISGVEAMDEILDIPTLEYQKETKKINSYDVEFVNVNYSYDIEQKSALNNISFMAKQNQITALVGASGSGKSTIAHLIPRFFDVDNGEILIGNENIKNFDNDYLMDLVTFVFQDVFIFKQSIIENVRMSNPNASEDKVIKACKAAQCHDFIMELPNKYQTIIGKENIHLSGGEKQRIAIARAIIKDAPIVVLDEATAFSDPQNENLIQKAFEKLLKDKTVIMIAHRLSTIKNAHNIIVLNDSQIVEQGSHKQLIANESYYYRMYNLYLKTSSWKLSNRKEHSNV